MSVSIEYGHRLSINRPTKRGKTKSPSNGHFQKEMDDHLLACHQFLTESHINDISFFGTSDYIVDL
jgi:hypothetical protein